MRKVLYLHIFIFVSSLFIAALIWANEWEEKPYTEWSREATIAMLTHSPWATREVIQEEESPVQPSAPGAQDGSSSGSSPTPSAVPRSGSSAETRNARTYSITFMSARPIRMALARWALLSGNVSRAKAEQFLSYNPYGSSIVIAVAVPPGQDVSELENLKVENLEDTTFLHLEKSDRSLNLIQYVPPSQSGNNGGLFFFPGIEDDQPTVTVEEEKIRFESRINDRTKFDEQFSLEKMVFKGELEL